MGQYAAPWLEQARGACASARALEGCGLGADVCEGSSYEPEWGAIAARCAPSAECGSRQRSLSDAPGLRSAACARARRPACRPHS